MNKYLTIEKVKRGYHLLVRMDKPPHSMESVIFEDMNDLLTFIANHMQGEEKTE